MEGFDDILTQLDRDEEEDEEPREKKKKIKKKRRETAGMRSRMLEEAKATLLKNKIERLKEIKTRVQAEWAVNQELSLTYPKQHELIKPAIEESVKLTSQLEKDWDLFVRERRAQERWEDYLKCYKLPNPNDVKEMNTYLYLWTNVEKNPHMDNCIKKVEEVFQLLDGLQRAMNELDPGTPATTIRDMEEVKSEIRRVTREFINSSTFYLLSRIKTDLESINITTSKYFNKGVNFAVYLWAELFTFLPLAKNIESRRPLKVVCAEVDVTVTIPVNLLEIRKVLRILWLQYDHWSDKCRTFKCPPVPEYFKCNKFQLFMLEHDMKNSIINERFQQEKHMKAKITGLPHDLTASQELLVWDSEPHREISDEVNYREIQEEEEMGNSIKDSLLEHEINLRERTILGPILAVQMFLQPTQPIYFRERHNLTLHPEPPTLHNIDYHIIYPPPFSLQPPEPESPAPTTEEGEEEEEEETIVIFRREVDITLELKKMIMVKIKPDPNIIWFEVPRVAMWDSTKNYWTDEDIHETTYDEEELTLTFKLGRLGIMALHVNRFLNFPFLDWIFEGDNEGVRFFLKTSRIELKFRIKEDGVCLESMVDAPSEKLEHMMGNYYPPRKLIEIMKKVGINIFPDPDTSCYVEDVSSKQIVIENSIYDVWALFSRSFRFRRSKFNHGLGKREFVFQAQEIYEGRQIDFCLLHVSLTEAYILDINEDYVSYDSQQAPNSEIYTDLYKLLWNNCTRNARRNTDVTNFVYFHTIKEFMGSVRPLSFTI